MRGNFGLKLQNSPVSRPGVGSKQRLQIGTHSFSYDNVDEGNRILCSAEPVARLRPTLLYLCLDSVFLGPYHISGMGGCKCQYQFYLQMGLFTQLFSSNRLSKTTLFWLHVDISIHQSSSPKLFFQCEILLKVHVSRCEFLTSHHLNHHKFNSRKRGYS